MAKGLRASTRKKNNAALRAKIFGPAVDARTERLSAKLLELAAKPKPESEKVMEIDEPEKTDDMASTGSHDEEMDVDAEGAKTTSTKRKSKDKRNTGRIQKKLSKRKTRHSVVFPPVIAKQRRQAAERRRK